MSTSDTTKSSSFGDREQRLENLGFPIGQPSPGGGLFDALTIVGDIVYASGQVAMDGGRLVSSGKVPTDVTVEQASAAAALCAANLLRAVSHGLGGLNRVKRVVRLTGYVNSLPDFTEQHIVINGASRLVREVFGEAGRHSRSAIGVAQLPLGSSVEVEMILQVES